MKLSEAQIRGAIGEQAGEWFVAHRSGSLALADRVAFVRWLRASPAHVEEYLGIALVARDLPAASAEVQDSPDVLVAQARAERAVATLQPDIAASAASAKRAWIHRPWALAASAACCAVVVAALVIGRLHDGELFGLPKTHHTAHGEQSAVLLPDGSLLRLNTDSSVTVRFSGAERVVDLQQGQVLFEVVHENRRGFRVTVGNAQVRAVGTEFDLQRRSSAILVTVVEGRVAVSTAGTGPAVSTGNDLQRRQEVPAGYQLRIDAGVISGQPTAVDLHQAEAWVQRRIVFERRPLSEVAQEFNRYGPVPLIISDPALGALPVSGVFDAYDTDSFVAFLGTLPGVKVERTPTQIRIRADRDAAPAAHIRSPLDNADGGGSRADVSGPPR